MNDVYSYSDWWKASISIVVVTSTVAYTLYRKQKLSRASSQSSSTSSQSSAPLNLFHPEKNTLDKIVSQIMGILSYFRIISLSDIALGRCSTSSQESQSHYHDHEPLIKLRNHMNKTDAAALPKAYKAWSSLYPMIMISNANDNDNDNDNSKDGSVVNVSGDNVSSSGSGTRTRAPTRNDIIVGNVTVSVDKDEQVDVLKEWGIGIDEGIPVMPSISANDVSVKLMCPASAFKKMAFTDNTNNNNDGKENENENGILKMQDNNVETDGCHKFHDCSLRDIANALALSDDNKHDNNDDSPIDSTPTVTPILIWFHGGGMITGSADESIILDLVPSLVLDNDNTNNMDTKTKAANPRPLVILSVEYRLAPEHPFPCAIIDALNVVSNVMQSMPVAIPIHIAGISAGGNLATVAGFEAHRRFPGRVKSIVALQPMLEPNVIQSASYAFNSRSSFSCPVEFLYYSWSAYLQLEQETQEHGDSSKSDSDEHKAETPETETETLTKTEKYTKMLHSSKWYTEPKVNGNGDDKGKLTSKKLPLRQTELWRLCCPHHDVPSGLLGNNANANTDADADANTDADADAPKIIVQTSKADPLHDDALLLVNAIQNKHKLEQKQQGGNNNSNIDSDTNLDSNNNKNSNSNVFLSDTKGSHVFSLLFYNDTQDKITKEWRNALYPPHG